MLFGDELFVKRAQSVLKDHLVGEEHEDADDVEDGQDAACLAETLDDGVRGVTDIGLQTVARIDVEPDEFAIKLRERELPVALLKGFDLIRFRSISIE